VTTSHSVGFTPREQRVADPFVATNSWNRGGGSPSDVFRRGVDGRREDADEHVAADAENTVA
jgi:hypothetical protein